MPKNSAEYMRDYRARKKAMQEPKADAGLTAFLDGARAGGFSDWEIFHSPWRVRELEAEVARLKRDLAARPAVPALDRDMQTAIRVNTAGFGRSYAAPKPVRRGK